MKTVGQILIILIAALLVIGAAYALAQTTAASALVGQPIGQSGIEGQAGPPDFANGQVQRAAVITREAADHGQPSDAIYLKW